MTEADRNVFEITKLEDEVFEVKECDKISTIDKIIYSLPAFSKISCIIVIK